MLRGDDELGKANRKTMTIPILKELTERARQAGWTSRGEEDVETTLLAGGPATTPRGH